MIKIDLSCLSLKEQNEIFTQFYDDHGYYGYNKKWNYHHRPSTGKYWIEILDPALKTFWLLKNHE